MELDSLILSLSSVNIRISITDHHISKDAEPLTGQLPES